MSNTADMNSVVSMTVSCILFMSYTTKISCLCVTLIQMTMQSKLCEKIVSKWPLTGFCRGWALTLQVEASGMDIELKGGAFKARPYKNPFSGPFDLIFSHNFDLGTKIT